MLHSAYRAVEVRVRESLLLERAERAARALSPEQHATMRKYYDAAIRRSDVANDLVDARSMVPALILYREALQLVLAAVVISRGGDLDVESLRTPAPWDQFAALVRQGRVEAPPSAVPQAKEVLAEGDPLAFDSWSRADLAARLATVEEAVRWLAALVEPRTPRQIVVSRSVHLGIFAVVVIGALVWGLVVLLRPPNLALHKTVTISERFPLSLAPTDNSGLVNGEIEAGYGIHTSIGSAWIMVDLRKASRISQVRVYNRADGWFDDGLPFAIEFSDDGTHFTEVSRRTTSFSSTAPWSYDAGGRQARYVRMRSDRYIAITELEVYGRQ
jgi:hypothetical protein